MEKRARPFGLTARGRSWCLPGDMQSLKRGARKAPRPATRNLSDRRLRYFCRRLKIRTLKKRLKKIQARILWRIGFFALQAGSKGKTIRKYSAKVKYPEGHTQYRCIISSTRLSCILRIKQNKLQAICLLDGSSVVVIHLSWSSVPAALFNTRR